LRRIPKAALAIGVLAGVNLFLKGLALVMIAIGVRSAKQTG
jgi:uncharacterized membrane protein YqhA